MTTDVIFPGGALPVVDIPFDAGAFTTNGTMTWTVLSAQQLAYWYTILSPGLATVSFRFGGTTLGVAGNTECRVTLPNGWVIGPSGRSSSSPIYVIEPTVGVQTGIVDVNIGNTYLTFKKESQAAWTTGAGLTITGQVTLNYQ